MTKLESFIREVECFDTVWFRSIGGDSARHELQELQSSERRGADTAIAKIRQWATAQKIRCVEERESLGGLENLESWLKWRGSEHTVDALLEFLEEIES